MKKYVSLFLVFLISCPTFGADVKWTAKSELTAIDDADVLLVVDDPGGTPISKKITVLNFFDTIDTSLKLLTILTDETGTGVSVFGTAPTFTTSITITGADHNPATAGEIRYDNTITGIMSGGGLRWYDDDSVRLLVDLETDPSNDDYVVAYDSTADGFYMKVDADSGGATAWDDITDPDNDGLTTIDFDHASENTLFTTIYDAAGSFFTINNSDAALANNTYLFHLFYSVDDDEANADYLKCEDAGGIVFTIQQDGDMVTTGDFQAASLTDGTATLTGGALTGLTTALTVAQGGTGATSLNDGFVLLGSNTAAITPLDVTTDGGIIIGDGTTDPVVLDVGSSTAITILGTVATGTWQATAIADAYIPDNITIDLATLATTVTVSDDENTDDEHEIVFTTDNANLESDGDITYNPATGELRVAANIVGEPKHLIFNIFNPLGVQTDDTQVCIWPVTPAALTVTKIVVTLDAAGNEVAGDLKWADTFIGLANATVINTFDTSSGVTSDDSITAGTVAAGKAIYIQFDSAPHTDITQMSVDITFDFD